MPEEGIETQELKESLEQAAEHAERRHEGKVAAEWILYLSLSTALIAVFAAIAALQSGSYANDAIVQKNESILNQERASDQWSYYQAKGVKSVVFDSQAEAVAATNPELAAKLRGEAAHEKESQEAVKKAAEDFEQKAERADAESEHSLHTHHAYAKSVTIFQVAIALAAIGALTRRRAMWLVSLGIGAAGLYFFLLGFGLFGH